jgi:hypothetical protein
VALGHHTVHRTILDSVTTPFDKSFSCLTTPSAAQIVWSRAELLANNELERIWKEAVVAYFKILSQGSLEEAEKKT